MRIGAIFARGSCRVLKWTALFGVVFALGAGQALAQELGRISAIEIDGAVEKDINGKRMHVGEGDLTELEITVLWNHDDITALWDTANAGTLTPNAIPPPPAIVDIVVVSTDADMAIDSAEWLSPAETDENPTLMDPAFGGKDVVLANNQIRVPVPSRPSSNPGSDQHDAPSTGKTTITFSRDFDAEDEGFRIDVVTDGATAGVLTDLGTLMSDIHVIEDIEVQGITLTKTSTTPIYEGGPDVAFKVVASPAREDIDLEVDFDVLILNEVSVSTRSYILSKSRGTIGTGVGADDTFTLEVDDNDGNREDDDLEVIAEVTSFSLSTGAYDDIRTSKVPITVLDVHKLPVLTMVDPEMETVVEGDTIEVTLTLDRNPEETRAIDPEVLRYTSEPIRVTVTAMDGATTATMGTDFQILDSPSLTDEHNRAAPWTQEVTVEIKAMVDDDLDPDEMVVLDVKLEATDLTLGAGEMEYPGESTLTIMDDTGKLVWAKTPDEVYAALMAAKGDGDFNPRMTFEVMGSSMFNADEGVTLGFTSESDNMDIASTSVTSGMVVVTAGNMEGLAQITVTAYASMPSGVTIATQTVPDEASVTFPVSVVLADLSVTVAADPEEIMEGGISTITASANRTVVEDTTIALDVISSDGNDDHQLEITIEAGMRSGSVELQAATDDDYMDSSYTLLASGPGIGGSVRLLVTVIDSDEAPVDEPTVSAKSQELVDLVFATAIADARTGSEWTEGGADAMVDMSELFDVADGASPAYSGVPSDEMVVEASSSGMMLSLTPAAEGMARITVTASDSASGDVATASSDVTVAELPLSVRVSASAAMVAEGGSITLTATANKMVDAATPVVVTRDGASQAGADDYTVGELMIAAGEMTGTAMLMATDDSDVEGNESLTLNAMVGDMSAGMVMVTIEDNDAETTYTLSASAEMVMEGGEVTITATASQMVDAATPVVVTRDGASQAGADDYTVGELMIAAGEMTGTAMLMATDDSDVEGNESLTLNAMVGDMSAGMVTVTIEDNDAETTYTLSASAEMVMEGGEVTITATASQMVRANTEVMVMRDASSTAGEEGVDYSVSPPLITIVEGETTGSLTLTAIDDTDVEGDETLTLNGMVDDMNAGSVMLTVTDDDMEITYALTGPENMNLVEGMDHANGTKAAAMLTVTASSAVPMDTEVEVMRDGTSTAGADDFTAEAIMIMAGETMGTTMVMAEEDNMAEEMEMLTLYGMVDGMSTNSVSFYLWDAAVPALPLIAQLLLAAFLAIGGYRRYLRR